jgi:hypothetical protein
VRGVINVINWRCKVVALSHRQPLLDALLVE